MRSPGGAAMPEDSAIEGALWQDKKSLNAASLAATAPDDATFSAGSEPAWLCQPALPLPR